MRKVTVFSTKTNKTNEVETSATTWAELKAELDAKGIEHQGMKSVVKESRVTLEADAAMLPEGDFTLFNFPQKVKSGNELSNAESMESAIYRLHNKLDSLIESVSEVKQEVISVKEEVIAKLDSFEGSSTNDEPVNYELKSEADKLAQELGLTSSSYNSSSAEDDSDDDDYGDDY